MKTAGRTVEYVWPPFRTASYRMDDGELRRLSAMGFDFVRVTVDPSIVIRSTGERWTELAAAMRATVRRFTAAGFAVVFDLHPVAVNPEFRPEALVDRASPEPFARFAEAVGRVAAMLADEPPDRVVLEPMNEPWIERLDETPRWLAMQAELHRRARAAAPVLPLVLTGVQWGSIPALLRLDTGSYRGSNVLYTFHYYDPHYYTHQGVEGGGESPYLSGVAWPATRANAGAALAKVERRLAAAPLSPAERAKAAAEYRQILDDLVRAGHGPETIGRDFDTVVAWGARNGIGPERILLGEFGCVNVAVGEPLGESRLAWIEAVRSAAEQRGLPWAFWVYKGWGGMALFSGSGILDGPTAAALGLSPG